MIPLTSVVIITHESIETFLDYRCDDEHPMLEKRRIVTPVMHLNTIMLDLNTDSCSLAAASETIKEEANA